MRKWHDTTCNQIHRTVNYSQHSSVISLLWLIGWVFDYQLNGCGFESRCSHLILGYGVCFEQGNPWNSRIDDDDDDDDELFFWYGSPTKGV